MFKKTCPICGKEFETKSKNRKYCGEECATEAYKEQVKAYRKANKYAPNLAQKKNKADTGKKKGKRVSLMEEYAKARENGTHGGLTYGYWVARMYRQSEKTQGA